MSKQFFSFAHLFGGTPPKGAGPAGRRPKAEEEQKPEAEAEDNTDDENAEDAEDGEGDEENTDQENAEDGDGDETAEEKPKESSAERKARARERARIGAIVTSKAAAGRLQAALHLALNTDLAPKAAIGTLKALPAADAASGGSGGRLADRMERQGRVDLGGGGGGSEESARSGPRSFKEIQQRRAQRAASGGNR